MNLREIATEILSRFLPPQVFLPAKNQAGNATGISIPGIKNLGGPDSASIALAFLQGHFSILLIQRPTSFWLLKTNKQNYALSEVDQTLHHDRVYSYRFLNLASLAQRPTWLWLLKTNKQTKLCTV